MKATIVKPACPSPCQDCPWRLANQGRVDDPHKFYTARNLARLWMGLKNGARMSCHPTDPRMAAFKGFEDQADRSTTNECAGALVLQQRELTVFATIAESAPRGQGLRLYRAQRPGGLSRRGLIALVERSAFGSAFGDVAMTTVALNDMEIGYSKVPWDQRSLEHT